MSQQPPRTDEHQYWEKWINSRDTEAGDILVKKYMPLVSYHVQRISVGLPKRLERRYKESWVDGITGCSSEVWSYQGSEIWYVCFISSQGSHSWRIEKGRLASKVHQGPGEKIEAKTVELEQLLLRHVTAEEVAASLEMSPEEVYQATNEHFFANVLSMDEQLTDDDHESQHYSLKDDKTISPEEEVLKGERLSELEDRIKSLSEKEQLVLSLFYKEELTLTEIGEVMKLSTSRISQIHSKSIFKLRNLLDT